MRAYVYDLFSEYAANGTPVMQPMFYTFPADLNCTAPGVVEDQFMFGPKLLVAPIYTNGTVDGVSGTARSVYLPALPAGETWTNVYTLKVHDAKAAQMLTVESDRAAFPLFTRAAHPSEIFAGPTSPLPGFWAAAAKGRGSGAGRDEA